MFAIALGYEDLNDHDELPPRSGADGAGRPAEAKRSDCAPLAGPFDKLRIRVDLNRLELSRPEPTRCHKIAFDAEAIERLFVTS